MRLLVLTDYFPPHVPSGTTSLLPRALAALLEHDHAISVLTGRHTEPNASPPPDHRLAVRRLLRHGGLLGGPLNYYDTRRVLEVTQPDLVLVWDALKLTSCPVHAALHASEAPIVWALTDPGLARFRPWALDRLGLSRLPFTQTFAFDGTLRGQLAAAGLPVAEARLFTPADLDAPAEAFNRYLAKINVDSRFERYRPISEYKRNPRPFLQA